MLQKCQANQSPYFRNDFNRVFRIFKRFPLSSLLTFTKTTMKKLKKEDIKQEVFDLYDDYAHDRVSRRLFLDKLGTYAVGGITVGSLLSFISPDYVKKIQIRQDDSRLKSEFIEYTSSKGGGTIKGLLSRPADVTFNHLKNHPECSGKVGVVGFCFGGWISNMMAVKVSDLGAAVPFYGGQPKEDIDKINAPLLLHFGELDKRVNAGWPAYEAALKEHGKEYTAHMYENANHGFHNDTTPRYDREAAELAWKRTIDFFTEKLG